jgi:transcriptional regulator with XRE-family HTH domain
MMDVMHWWDRLEEAREEKGWSRKELSKRSGLPYTNINKYLDGKIAQPRGDVMEILAKTVEKSVLWLRDGLTQDDEATVKPLPGRLAVASLVGRVEAGMFREIDDLDQSEPTLLNVPPDDRFPQARQLVFDVSGDSMNALKPRPILDGDRIVGVAYEDIAHEVVLRDGMVVVVERTRDAGHYREWSVKQLVLLQDRTEFHPRSTNPRYKPIVVDRDMHADDGLQVQIICLVRRFRSSPNAAVRRTFGFVPRHQ